MSYPANKLTLIITTPEHEVFRGTADSVSIPTVDGEITVLPHHVPLSTVLKPGEMIIRQGENHQPYAISGGFAEIQPTKVVLLADTAEHIAEIDEARAQEAITRAQEAMKQEISKEHVEYAGIAAKLERDLARIHVIRKHRHHGHQGIPYEGVRKE